MTLTPFRLIAVAFGFAAPVWAADSVTSAPQAIPGLGTTAFQTSTASRPAQEAFMRGLLLLHLFEYADAADAFVSAQKLDPAFAMAYWGEAMTHNHGVWNQVDVNAGKAALDKFAPDASTRAARSADPRERDYLAAIECLYDGAGSKPERDGRYAKAMEGLSRTYPDDRNAQLFYALALLGQSEGVRDIAAYLQAAAISKAIFRLEPNNPGAAHYWIHGMDDPEHAAGALEAARALSTIAPDAPHAQHMCSHIFMALGMWDDVVNANVEAMRVSDRRDVADGFPAFNCGHYQEWLEYGYFQQGRFRAAQQAVAACRQADADVANWLTSHPGKLPYGAKNIARFRQRLAEGIAGMQEMAMVESQDWTAAASSTPATGTGAWTYFVTGFAAAQRGDSTNAASALQAMRTKTSAYRATPGSDPQELQALVAGAGELAGLLQIKNGHYEAGLTEVRHAADTYRAMPFGFGPPVTVKPPDELLGEILLAHGDSTAARRSFEQSLERAPGRTQSLLGLARAQRLSGDGIASRKTYKTLSAIWHEADPAVPGLQEARSAE